MNVFQINERISAWLSGLQLWEKLDKNRLLDIKCRFKFVKFSLGLRNLYFFFFTNSLCFDNVQVDLETKNYKIFF